MDYDQVNGKERVDIFIEHKPVGEPQRETGKPRGTETILQKRTRELQERLKELDCLYSISKLIENAALSIREILQGTVEAIPRAWQYPTITCARIIHDTCSVMSGNFHPTPWKQTQAIKVRGQIAGRVEVHYLEQKPQRDEGPFLKEERNLLNVIAERLGHVIEWKKAEKELREREKELAAKNENLQEVNTALKVILKRREEDRIELEEKVVANVKEMVLPYLKKLKWKGLDETQSGLLNILENNLRDIVSGFQRGLTSTYLNITPTELRVADLVRQGRTTKEISDLLNRSIRAVEFHRANLRKKLGLKNRKINLRSHLLSLR